MKMNYKSISTVLILVLTGLLVGILIRYYNTPIRVSNTMNVNKLESSGETNHDNPIIISKESSGEFVSNNAIVPEENRDTETLISSSGEMNTKVDYNNEEVKPALTQIPEESKSPKINEKGSQVIITSEDSMTNKEKREILTELDNTLMELLDVVDKVQTVDETRLMVDESEVQK